MLELMADGTAVLSRNMTMMDFDYRLDGNRLVLTGREESLMPPIVVNYEVRFDGGALVQKDPGSVVETRMRRVGKAPPGGPTLVGAWRRDLSMQDLSSLSLDERLGGLITNTTTIVFTTDGRMLLREGFGKAGTWSLAGDALVVTVGEQRLTFHFDEDSQVLYSSRRDDLALLHRAEPARPREASSPPPEASGEATGSARPAPPPSSAPARRLVGRWEFRKPTCDGTVLELMADGTAVLSPDMEITDFDYRLDGNQLVLTVHDQSCARPVLIYEVRFDGTALVQKDARGVETRMLRVGKAPPGGPTLVGAWRYDVSREILSAVSLDERLGLQMLAATTSIVFTTDGKMLLRQGSGEAGTWSLEGDTLVVTVEESYGVSGPPGGPERITFRVAEDAQVLHSSRMDALRELRRADW